MKRALAVFAGGAVWLVLAGLVFGADAWQKDQDARGFKLYGLGAPTVSTGAPRVQDLAPGACIPKSPGANTLPFICSVAETDYITPAYTFGGDLSGTPASANVIGVTVSGPTHLTFGAWADGAIPKRSGTTIIGATAGTDYENALTVTAPIHRAGNVLSIDANGVTSALIRQSAATSVMGNATGSTANVADIVCSADGAFVGRAAGALTCTAAIPLTSLSGLYSSSLPVGPTALGSVGAATTVIRSDATAPAYRSDTIATTYCIDPVSGSDAAANAGTSCAVALATLGELRRRWWGADIRSSVTVTIVGDIPDADIGEWNFTVKPNVLITFVGSVGATTGFGGRAVDNTLYSGTVTGFVAATNGPAADDIKLTDSAIPTSFTASGLMARGVLFQRTSGAARFWWAAKDLGSKTIRISAPQDTNIGQTMASTLSNGDSYSAYQLWTMPPQKFQAASISAGNVRIRIDKLLDKTGTIDVSAYLYRNSWIVRSVLYIRSLINCSLEINSGATLIQTSPAGPAPLFGGLLIGTSTTNTLTVFGISGIGGPVVAQNVQLVSNDGAFVTIEAGIASHDNASTLLVATNGGLIQFANNSFLSGKGNSGKLASADLNSSIGYGTGSLPPWVAGSTSDGSPITVGSTSYAVASVPATTDTLLTPAAPFPSVMFETSGPTRLTWGAVASGALVKRSGTTIIGATAGTDYAAPGNYITSLTGDVTAAGPGAASATLASVGGGAGSCTYCSVTFDAKGRQTAYSSGATPALASRTLTAGAGMTGGGTLAADRTFDVVAGDATIVVNTNDIVAGVMQTANYAAASVTLPKIVSFITDSFPCRDTAGTGDLEVCSVGGGIEFTGGPGIRTSAFTGDVTKSAGGTALTLATVNSNVGSFTNASVTVNAKGLVTAASSGAAPVTSVSGTSGRISSTGGTTPVLDLVASGVTPGSYTATDLTVDAYGRITAAANGSAGGGGSVTVVTATAPFVITSTPTTTPNVTSSVLTDTLLGRDTAGTGVVEQLSVGGGIEFTGGPGIQRSHITGDVDVPAGSNTSTLATVNASPSTYTYATLTVNGKGLVTSATSGAAPAPSGATYLTQTTNGTLSAEQAMTSLAASGVMTVNNSTGVVGSFGVGTARVPYGSGTLGGITDSANMQFNGQTFGLGSIQELQIYNASTSTTAIAGYRIGTDASFTNSFSFGMPGTNWSGGALSPNAGLIELNAGAAPVIISNLGTGKTSFTTTSGRTERMAILTGGDVTIANHLLIGGGAVDAPLSVDAGGLITAIHFASGAADSGGYLLSTADHQAILSGGMAYNGTNWVAKATTASSVLENSGTTIFYGDTGLTPGSTFSPTTRMTIGTTGTITASSLTAGGVMWANTSGVIAAAPVQADAFIISGGTTAAPYGASFFAHDFAHDIVEFGDDVSMALYNTGRGGTGTYERMRTYKTANVYHITSETSGGTVRPITVDAGTATLTLAGANVTSTASADVTVTASDDVLLTAADSFESYGGSSWVGGILNTNAFVASTTTGLGLGAHGGRIASTNAIWDAVYSDTFTTISGSGTISTAGGFNANVFKTPGLQTTGGSVTVDSTATVYIQNSPQAGSGVTIGAAYSLFVDDGLARFDGDGSGNVFEFPSHGCGACVATVPDGRIPILITGVGVRYLRYFTN